MLSGCYKGNPSSLKIPYEIGPRLSQEVEMKEVFPRVSALLTASITVTLFYGTACSSKNDPFHNKTGCASNGQPMGTVLFTGTNLPDNSLVLTFDGGPSDYTAEIGEFLWQNDKRATFFVTGRNVHKNDDRLQRLKGNGHLVGNLSYDNVSLNDSPDPLQSIRRTDELITPYVTGNMFLFRPPQGSFSDDLAYKVQRAGLKKYVGPIGWDIGSVSEGGGLAALDADCWQMKQDPEVCASRYMQAIHAKRKGILVFHDIFPNSLALVKKVVAQAISESYGFIRLDAIPEIKAMIDRNGGVFDQNSGDYACNDYE